MKFCTSSEGNPGNVLLTRRNPPKYFYQCMYIRKVRNRIGKKVRILKHAGKVRKLPFLYLIARLRSTASFARFSSFNISLAGCLTFCSAKCILVNDEDVLIQIWRDRISKQLQMEPIKASFFAHVQCTLEILRGQQWDNPPWSQAFAIREFLFGFK